MNKKTHSLTAVILSFVMLAIGCSGGEIEPEIPNPGFGIYSTYRDIYNFESTLPGASTYGEVGRSYFGTLVGVGSGATGAYWTFGVTANEKGKAYVYDTLAPAFYKVTAGTGWSKCTGMTGTVHIDRGVLNHLECKEYRIGGPILGGPFSNSTINVNTAAVEFTMGGEGINAAYGMPTFQFFNQYGTLVAQTPATAIDTENGIWAKGWSNCLTGLPVGPYNVLLMNATADGVGQRAGASSVYLAGGPDMVAIDDPGFFVHQHYLDFLNRDPDEAGWQYWTNQITQCGSNAACIEGKRIDVSRAFWYADEFLQLHPGLRNAPGVTPDFNNDEFVRLCYLIYLGRFPDQFTYNARLAQLNSTNDYNQIISDFINSDEYRARFMPQVAEEPPPSPTECPPCPAGMECMPCYEL